MRRSKISLTSGVAAFVGCALVSTGRPAIAGVSPADPDTSSSVHSQQIPAFARLFGTSCSTCHTAAPKLNVLGEAFRTNGYRMPDADLLLRVDEPVNLGNDAWKEEWPRSIWPGDLPGLAPFSLRIQSDLRVSRGDGSARVGASFRFPNEVYLLAGAPLGESIGAYFESEWADGAGLEIVQAKVTFQDVLPGLPKRALNLWVGQQNLYLFTFASEQIDRAAKLKFKWQGFTPRQLELRNGDDLVVSQSGFKLGASQPAIELNGLIGSRLTWGAGIAQGVGNRREDDNGAKDVYYRARYKIGGMDFRGAYPEGGGPVTGSGGQLLDRSLTLEHFGYLGKGVAIGEGSDRYEALGLAARARYARWDVGAGYVWNRHDSPWAPITNGGFSMTSVFGKIEYLGLPWLITSAKIDHRTTALQEGLVVGGFTGGESNLTRLMPGVVVLIRQNLRLVLEGDLTLQDTASDALLRAWNRTLWMRLDVAF